MPAYPPPPDLSPFARKAEIPSPAGEMPPGIADAGRLGTEPEKYALADHTHASRARRMRLQTASDGLITWTFDPPFALGVVPRIQAIAETAVGVTDVVNVQVEGTPSNTQVALRVNRTVRSVAALLGLTVLSVPASPGATWIHASAFEA